MQSNDGVLAEHILKQHLHKGNGLMTNNERIIRNAYQTAEIKDIAG